MYTLQCTVLNRALPLLGWLLEIRPIYHEPRPFSKSKFNLKSDRVNLVAPASPIECLLYLPNVQAIQWELGPERLTRLGNSNALRLPVIVSWIYSFLGIFLYFWFIIIILISLNIMDNYLLSTYKVKSNQKKYSDRFSLQNMKCKKKFERIWNS